MAHSVIAAGEAAKILFGVFGRPILVLTVVGVGCLWGAKKLEQRKAKKVRPLDAVVETNARLAPY